MKNIKISLSKLSGNINIPPSKSLSHRAIIAASLAEGRSKIRNVLFSEDIEATCKGMKVFGVNIEKKYDSLIIDGTGILNAIDEKIDCNESGSTLRFLIPLALLTGQKMIFEGKGRLTKRPINPYIDIFKKQEIDYIYDNGLPLIVKGRLKPDIFKIKGDISSQFITGLLFVLPLLCDDSKILITSELESKGYIDLTIDILDKFGVKIINNEYKEFFIKGNQKYTPIDYRIEGDFSQAAFWIVAGVLGGEVEIKDLNIDSLQGDRIIVDIVKKMGGDLLELDNSILARKSKTNGTIIDVSGCPDLAPVLAVLGALSEGETRIINAERLRIKESDRVKAIATELNKIGADVIEKEDSLIIKGKDMLEGGIVDSWNDHRIVMALSIASIKCTKPLIITNSDVVKKSYPQFFEDFKKLGGKVYEWNMGK